MPTPCDPLTWQTHMRGCTSTLTHKFICSWTRTCACVNWTHAGIDEAAAVTFELAALQAAGVLPGSWQGVHSNAAIQVQPFNLRTCVLSTSAQHECCLLLMLSAERPQMRTCTCAQHAQHTSTHTQTRCTNSASRVIMGAPAHINGLAPAHMLPLHCHAAVVDAAAGPLAYPYVSTQACALY